MATEMTVYRFKIYRYKPDTDTAPHMEDYELSVPKGSDMMLLGAMMQLKEQDSTLGFRRSCGEGVCGSDAMNINGKNGLACIMQLSQLKQPIILRPLTAFPVIRDLIVDMTLFYEHYHSIKPYLVSNSVAPAKEYLQSPEDRAKLDGLYECILCACCTSSCPSFWWNPDKFKGPAALLQAYRWVVDSRDEATRERLEGLSDPFSAFRCRSIMNCVDVCPKNLNPTKAIEKLRDQMLEEGV